MERSTIPIGKFEALLRINIDSDINMEEEERGVRISTFIENEEKAPVSPFSIFDPPEYSALWYADRIVALEAKLKDRNKHIRELADAASVLWDEHKEYSEELFGVKGCDVHGGDSEGHEMMQDILNTALAVSSSPDTHDTTK